MEVSQSVLYTLTLPTCFRRVLYNGLLQMLLEVSTQVITKDHEHVAKAARVPTSSSSSMSASALYMQAEVGAEVDAGVLYLFPRCLTIIAERLEWKLGRYFKNASKDNGHGQREGVQWKSLNLYDCNVKYNEDLDLDEYEDEDIHSGTSKVPIAFAPYSCIDSLPTISGDQCFIQEVSKSERINDLVIEGAYITALYSALLTMNYT